MFVKELLRLTRFEHALMLAFAVLIAETIVLGGLPPLSLAISLSLLVPIFSEMGSFALNDYFDVETDRLNRKTDRPLVRGTISPGFALWFSAAALAASSVIAFFINMPAFLIALFFNVVAILYNWRLKDLPLAGNIYIALTMAIPFVFGNLVVSSGLSGTALVLAALGFVAGLAREIVKTVQDVEGDVRGRGSRTLPVMIGKRPALAISIALYALFIPLSAAPFFLGLRPGILPTALIAAADALIAFICYGLWTAESYKQARDYSLTAFMLGMAGLLLASL